MELPEDVAWNVEYCAARQAVVPTYPGTVLVRLGLLLGFEAFFNIYHMLQAHKNPSQAKGR